MHEHTLSLSHISTEDIVSNTYTWTTFTWAYGLSGEYLYWNVKKK
jgi:hypothetical protein